MPPEEKQPRLERDHTDESLRIEREKADHALVAKLAAIDETADAVITRARARADDVLAATRAKSDRQSASRAPSQQSRLLEKQRGREDQVLREERSQADETLRDERAERAGLLATEREGTDKDLLSERARSDDVLATRDEFLGIVSHDLRNLLNGIVGYSVLIGEQVSREQHVQQVLMHAQRIQRLSARMDRLIGDLLDVASIEAGTLAVTRELGDPAQVVSEAVDAFHAQASASGVSLVAEILPPSSRATFDPARLLQVLSNLLSNAVKFTPPDGRVVVRVERVGDEIRFAVRDTGVGIPADKLEAVFERFLQITKNDRRGIGLGLYISKSIVQAHRGRIWAESRTGEGTTISFTLPIHSAS